MKNPQTKPEPEQRHTVCIRRSYYDKIARISSESTLPMSGIVEGLIESLSKGEPFDLAAAVKEKQIKDNKRRARLPQTDPDHLDDSDYQGDSTCL